MTDTTFLAERRAGIGGTDVAPILGLSRWKTPLEVWLAKRGEAPEVEDNASMEWGRRLEPVVRQAYADATQREIVVPDFMRHAEHNWMVGHLDGLAGERVLEIKTARTDFGWGEPGTDETPIEYWLQVQHYMMLTGLLVADIAVLIGASDFRIYTVDSDPASQERIFTAEREFWQRVVDAVPPEPRTLSDVKALWARKIPARKEAFADRDIVHAVELARALREQLQKLETAEDEQRAIIMRAMADAEVLTDDGGNVLATWKMPKAATYFDADAFERECPELHRAYLRERAPTRRFLLK
jgi:putative phage-type endonuclease